MAKKEFAISLKLLNEGFKKGIDVAKRSLKSFHKAVKSTNSKINFKGTKDQISKTFSTPMLTSFSKGLSKVGDNVQKQSRIMRSSFKKVKEEMSDFQKALIGFFAIDKIIDFGKSMFNVGMTFQNQMARVKAVSGATKEEFKALKKEAERLGATTMYSATEAAQALENLLRNGLSVSEAIIALEGVLKLAGSQAIDLSRAADIATSSLNGFGFSAKELNRVIDVLATGASSSATDVDGLAEGMKQAAPIAKLLGISLEEVVAILSVLANAGFAGGQGGTAIRTMLTRLVKLTKQAQEVMDKYKISMSESYIKTKGLTKALEELSKVGMSLSDIKIVFGEEYAAPISTLLGNYNGYTETKTKLEVGSKGEADRQFEEGVGSIKKAINELTSTFESTLIRFFDLGSDIFEGLINGAKTLLNEFNKISTYVVAGWAFMMRSISKISKEEQQKIEQQSVAQELQTNFDVIAAIAVQQARGKGLSRRNDPTRSELVETAEQLKEAISKYDSVQDKLSDHDKERLSKFREITREYLASLQKRIAYIDEVERRQSDLDRTERVSKPRMYYERDEELSDKYRTGKKKYWFNPGNVTGRTMYQLKKAKKGIDSARGKKNDVYFNPKKYKEHEDRYESNQELLKQREELLKNAESDLKGFEGQCKSVADRLVDLTGRPFEELLDLDIDAEYADLDEKLAKLKTNAEAAKNPINSIGTGIKNLFGKVKDLANTAVTTLFGGWINLLTTAAAWGIKKVYDAYQESKRVFKEIEEGHKKLVAENQTLEVSAISLAKVMSTMPKESAAWQDAMKKLSSAYPDLLKKMNLEQVYLEGNAEAYKKLCQSIKDVVKEQKNLKLEEYKQDSIQKLYDTYAQRTGNTDKKLVDIFTGTKFTDATGNTATMTKEAAEIVVSQIKADILAALEQGRGKQGINEVLNEAFSKYNVEGARLAVVNRNSEGLADAFSTALYSKFQPFEESISSIKALIPDTISYTAEKVSQIIEETLAISQSKANEITSVEKAKGKTDEEIKTMIINSNSAILDELVKRLSQITTKVNGKSALDYATSLPGYKQLLESSIHPVTEVTNDPDPDPIPKKSAKQIFNETNKYIKALKDSGIIDEKEARNRLLSAYESYISSLESEQKTNKDALNNLQSLMKERDKLKNTIDEANKKEEEANKLKEEEIEKAKERKQTAKDISSDMTYASDRNNHYKSYKWDSFNFSDKFEKELIGMEFEFSKLDDYLQELKSIGGEKWEIQKQIDELVKLGNVEGVRELIEQFQQLIKEIEKAEKEATNLDDVIQLKKAKKEIEDMEKESSRMIYDAVKNGVSGLDSLASSWTNLVEGWKDMSFGEQFSSITNAIFGTIDTVMSFLDALTQVTEFLELMGLKKQALSAIEATTSSTTIAATQAEAAAVIAAETEKTAAITGSLAAQTTANIAAKTLQTKAATIAMAAESTAAYAAIPFAGVGLAAAQIAEMEGLIAAASAIPVFAEGGIVGGSKYIGDQNLARVNSGEMIINGSQQSKLWNAISKNRLGDSSVNGSVEFVISGQVLKGVLQNHDKKMSKFK